MILDIASIDSAHVIEDNLSPNRRLPEDVRAAGYIPYLPDIEVGDLVLFGRASLHFISAGSSIV